MIRRSHGEETHRTARLGAKGEGFSGRLRQSHPTRSAYPPHPTNEVQSLLAGKNQEPAREQRRKVHKSALMQNPKRTHMRGVLSC